MPSFLNAALITLRLGLAACLCSSAVAQKTQSLEEGFRDPPASAHPRVWWHWMNGNITKEGIALDLDWMHRVGIAGFQNFDAAFNTPQVVDKRLVYMTPEWKDAFRFAIEKGDSLGFEMAVAGSPGWSESGGPWVKPSQAMKKLVWSETRIPGGKPFTGKLTPIPFQTGPFGNLAQPDLMGAMGSGKAPLVPDFGADVAVVAFREPQDSVPIEQLHPTLTSNGGTIANPALLWDGDLNHSVSIPVAPAGQSSWIQYDFGKPVTIRSVTFALGPPRDPLAIFGGEKNNGPLLQSSDDGTTFQTIVRMPTFGAVQHTLSFAPRTARYFRLSAESSSATASQNVEANEPGAASSGSAKMYPIAEFALYPDARVNRFEEKAAFAAVLDVYGFATDPADASSAIASADVVDLSAKMKPDGTLEWTPPPGRWTVLRLGYSLTGITNHPAPTEATGPEVDKLNRDDVKSYLDHYLDNYKDATGGLMGKRGLKYVITDSWEAGTQNWTNSMIAEFTRRRGYNPVPWLPAMTGRIVGSAKESDRFLWDVRKTIADLLAENHYGTIAETLHARGMGLYGESHEARRATIGDGMEMKRADDIPMSAMWVQQPGVNTEQYGYNADIRESASVAHIYGQNLVAAESMTAGSNPWDWSPATLKPTADKELAMGLNRFVIHSSVHQPLIGKAPGLTLGPFGQWFNRNEIWAEQAEPWITYLSRSSYLLQQGSFVADIVYFYGEDSNLTAIFDSKSPDIPKGFNYDYMNADALIHKLHNDQDRLGAGTETRYRVLVLDPYSRHMSLPVLRKIEELVNHGATVIGERPTDTPSLSDNLAEFKTLADKLWSASLDSRYGRGRILHGMSIADAVAKIGIHPDFSFAQPLPDSNVLFVHRVVGATDLFFVDNRNPRTENISADFRITGRAAELWHPDTGKIEDASYTTAGSITSVPLTLEPYGTVFVVFRNHVSESGHKPGVLSRSIAARHEVLLEPLRGPWDVQFEASRGAPTRVTLDSLVSLSENADPGIRYFAGHATYTHTVDAPAAWFHPGSEIWLDLGDVANLAEVKVNGQAAATAWKSPFRVEVSHILKPGKNTLEIRVANLWVNRLIGDAQPDNKTPVTFTTKNPYKASSPLVPSGLLGPVRFVLEEPAH